MHAIGIDLGTTSICGILMDRDTGEVLRSRTENSNAFLPGAQPWERIQSPEQILRLAREILEDLLQEDVAAIGISCQMHGIVYTDARGKAVSPLYTWQDGRGNQPYGDGTYAQALGSHSGYGNVTDFYNRENGLIPAEAVDFCTIGDLFAMELCGLTRPRIHITNAASFGCFDLKEGRFTRSRAQEPCRGFDLAGTYRGIPVAVAIGDNQASVFSSLPGTDSILLNMGTGSQVSLVTSQIPEAPGIEIRPYFDGQFLAVGAALCGGRAYAVLKDFYKSLLSHMGPVTDDRVYALMDDLLARPCGGLTVDTRLEGTRRDNSLRGSITGISTENFTPEALTRGFLEGMVEELYELYRAMGTQRRGLVGSGNGLRKNPALQKAAEDRFGMSLRIPAHREEAAFGAALYALVAAGQCKDAAEAQQRIRFA